VDVFLCKCGLTNNLWTLSTASGLKSATYFTFLYHILLSSSHLTCALSFSFTSQCHSFHQCPHMFLITRTLTHIFIIHLHMWIIQPTEHRSILNIGVGIPPPPRVWVYHQHQRSFQKAPSSVASAKQRTRMMLLHRRSKPFSFTVRITTHKVWDIKRQHRLSIPPHSRW
jgi:hypothetical protein